MDKVESCLPAQSHPEAHITALETELARLKEHLSSTDKASYDELCRLRAKEAKLAHAMIAQNETIESLKLQLTMVRSLVRSQQAETSTDAPPDQDPDCWLVSGEHLACFKLFDNAQDVALKEADRSGESVTLSRVFHHSTVKRTTVWTPYTPSAKSQIPAPDSAT